MQVGTLAKVSLFLVVAILLCVSPAVAQEPPIVAQGAAGTAFTYQGRLTVGGLPANGAYDFVFALWDAAAGGNPVGSPASIPVEDLAVVNGIFTVTLDFGRAFIGDEVWLEVSVRPGAAAPADPHQLLTPRTKINAAPFAMGLMPETWLRDQDVSHDYASFVVQNGWPGDIAPAKRAIVGLTSDGVAIGGYAGAGTGVRGFSSSAYGVYGSSPNGFGVYGLHEAATGTNPGVKGVTNSTDANAVAVLGSSSTAGASSAAVRGINNATGYGIGVWGSQAGVGNGVYGTSVSGNGVYGVTSNPGFLNAGVSGSGSNGATGVRGYSDTGNSIEGWSSGGWFGNLRFRVQTNGNVTADGAFTGGGADYAEMLAAEDGLEPGDLLAIGPTGDLVRAVGAHSTNVAGVYSTQPGFVAGGGDAEGNGLIGKVPLAVLGVVPAKASAENGAIVPGDLLTTSDTPGYAMRADPITVEGVSFYPSSVVVGKALEGLASGTGVIKILVTLQ